MLLPLILTFPPRGDKQFYIVIMHKIWLGELSFHLVCTGMQGRVQRNCFHAVCSEWGWGVRLKLRAFEPLIYLPDMWYIWQWKIHSFSLAELHVCSSVHKALLYAPPAPFTCGGDTEHKVIGIADRDPCQRPTSSRRQGGRYLLTLA